MPTLVIASARKGDPSDPESTWADLAILFHSIRFYAPKHHVVLAWKGSCPPESVLPDLPNVTVVRQPDEATTYGQAYEFAVGHAGGDELLLVNDDTVLCPDTIAVLMDDVDYIRREVPGVKIGMVAARTNRVWGAQNIRNPNGGMPDTSFNYYDSEQTVIQVDRVSPILAYTTRGALDAIGGFPPLNWFSDDVMCWDWEMRGYLHFVSRAYVHHIGQRSTGQDADNTALREAGLSWIQEHRPDFFAKLTGTWNEPMLSTGKLK